MRRISLCCVLLAQATHHAEAFGCLTKVANLHESGIMEKTKVSDLNGQNVKVAGVTETGGALCADMTNPVNGTWRRTEKPEGGAEVRCKFTASAQYGPQKYNCYRVCKFPPQGGPMKEPYCGGCCAKYACPLSDGSGMIAKGGADCIGAGSCATTKHNRMLWLQELYTDIQLPQRNLDTWQQGHREAMRDRLCEVFQEEARGGPGCGNPKGKCDQAFIDTLKADFEKEKKIMMDMDNKIRGKEFMYSATCSCSIPNLKWIPPWVEWDKIPMSIKDKSNTASTSGGLTYSSGEADYRYKGWPCGVGARANKKCHNSAEEDDKLLKELKDAGTNWKTFYKGPYLPAKACPLVCGGALTTGGGGSGTSGNTSAATGLVMSLGLLVLPLLSFWV